MGRNGRSPFPFWKFRFRNGRAILGVPTAGTVAFLGNFGRLGPSGTAYGTERAVPVPKIPVGTDGNGTGGSIGRGGLGREMDSRTTGGSNRMESEVVK
jgi:hypothetical protein